MRKQLLIITVCLAGMVAFVNPAAQAPRYSTDGDTAYLKDLAVIRDSGAHTITDPPPALLGSAPDGFITTTTWGPEIRLTHITDSIGGITQNPFGTIIQDTIVITFDISVDWSAAAPYAMKTTVAGDTWSPPFGISNPDTGQEATHLFINLFNGRLNTVGKVSWPQEYDYQNIYAKRSTNLGQTWSQPYFFFSLGQQYIGKYGGGLCRQPYGSILSWSFSPR
jgi:hypothetical protein